MFITIYLQCLCDRKLDCGLWTSSVRSLMASPNSAIQGLNLVSGCRWEEGKPIAYIPDLWNRMSLCSKRPLTASQFPLRCQVQLFTPTWETNSFIPRLFWRLIHSYVFRSLSHTKFILCLFFLSLNLEITLELVTITGGLGDDWGEVTYYQQAVHNPARNFCSRVRCAPK